MKKTLFDKVWDSHVVERSDNGPDILYIDKHLIHEVTSPQAFNELEEIDNKENINNTNNQEMKNNPINNKKEINQKFEETKNQKKFPPLFLYHYYKKCIKYFIFFKKFKNLDPKIDYQKISIYSLA